MYQWALFLFWDYQIPPIQNVQFLKKKIEKFLRSTIVFYNYVIGNKKWIATVCIVCIISYAKNNRHVRKNGTIKNIFICLMRPLDKWPFKGNYLKQNQLHCTVIEWGFISVVIDSITVSLNWMMMWRLRLQFEILPLYITRQRTCLSGKQVFHSLWIFPRVITRKHTLQEYKLVNIS